jgi:hypothetical protein
MAKEKVVKVDVRPKSEKFGDRAGYLRRYEDLEKSVGSGQVYERGEWS